MEKKEPYRIKPLTENKKNIFEEHIFNSGWNKGI